MKRVPASGGVVQVLCDVATPATMPAGAWGAKDFIIFAQSFGPLRKVSARGGDSTPVTFVNTERNEFGHYNPAFLPDGDHFAYEVGALPERLGIHVGSLTSTDTTQLVARYTGPFAVTSDGYLLFVNGGLLRAQRLDVNRLQMVGESTVVADGVANVSVSSNGTLVYRTEVSARTALTWFDRSGKRLETVSLPGGYHAPVLSPDDSKVAVGRDGDIWVLDLVRGTESRLTSEPSRDSWPVWSPDGREILYSRGIVGTIVRRPSNGTGAAEVVLEEGGIPWDWSADGRLITFAASSPATLSDLWVLPLFGEHKKELYLQTALQEFESKLSPDVKRMTYASYLSGQSEVYVQEYPASKERWQISPAGGFQPSWRRDGRELYYLDPDLRLMAVDITTTPSFTASVPRPLFRVTGPTGPGLGRSIYVPSRDGKRFLVNRFVEGGTTPIVVLLNWTKAITN